jgi:hypothetical protein
MKPSGKDLHQPNARRWVEIHPCRCTAYIKSLPMQSASIIQTSVLSWALGPGCRGHHSIHQHIHLHTHTTPSISSGYHSHHWNHAFMARLPTLSTPKALQWMASAPRAWSARKCPYQEDINACTSMALPSQKLASCVCYPVLPSVRAPVLYRLPSASTCTLSPDSRIHGSLKTKLSRRKRFRRPRWGKLARRRLNTPACMAPPHGIFTFFAYGAVTAAP